MILLVDSIWYNEAWEKNYFFFFGVFFLPLSPLSLDEPIQNFENPFFSATNRDVLRTSPSNALALNDVFRTSPSNGFNDVFFFGRNLNDACGGVAAMPTTHGSSSSSVSSSSTSRIWQLMTDFLALARRFLMSVSSMSSASKTTPQDESSSSGMLILSSEDSS